MAPAKKHNFECRRCGRLAWIRAEDPMPIRCSCGMVYRTLDDRGFSVYRRGLGDWLADFFDLFGITPNGVSRLTGRPCRCKHRQATLNRWVPFRRSR